MQFEHHASPSSAILLRMLCASSCSQDTQRNKLHHAAVSVVNYDARTQLQGEKSQFEGKLLGVDGREDPSPRAHMQLKDGTKLKFELSEVKKANLLYDW